MRISCNLILLAVLLAFAVALSGCKEPNAADTRNGKITIALKDFRFKPQNVQTKKGWLTLTLVNDGRVRHNFKLTSSEGWVAFKTADLKPGEKLVVRRKMKRGKYRIASTAANQEGLGMYGSLVVR